MKKDHAVILGLIVFIMLALPVFCVSHDTFAAASTITLTIDDSLVDMNITSTSPNGNFNKSNPSTITVSTTNATGYTLSIAATGGTNSNNPTKLVNTSENTALDSVSSAVTESDFKAANSTSYNNKWGFLPSKFNSVDNTSFLPSPTTVADDSILNQTSTANSTADTYTVSIGARIDHTTKAGSYNNTFVIYATANAIPYTITYDDGIVFNMPTDVAGETNESTVAISDNVPTRDGYAFFGWCTTDPINNNDTDVCSGTTYQPGDNIPISQTGGNNNYHLYAMWGPPPDLYDYVASAWESEGSRVQTNDTDTNTGIQADITTSNSGVFKYNPSTFGTSSDASNNHDIYYYRGILDNTVGSYGSDGDNIAHPNTVLLDTNKNGADTTDTCWRIIRTTGSGGVKLIYQGTWTGSTCANASTSAHTMYNGSELTVPYNATSSTVAGKTYTGLPYRNIHAVGYTYSNLADGTVSATAIGTIFGASGNDTTTNTNSSVMKQYIEDWYAGSLNSYTSLLEANAGYCNDRSVNEGTSWTIPASDSATIIPYGNYNSTEYYFGSYIRNATTTKAPSLTCTRGIVDLYSTTTASGGNGQLIYPIALLTADEVSFAGSGRNTASQASSYHTNSYLNSGSNFWLLSPSYRASDGSAEEFHMYLSGILSYNYLYVTRYGVRPAISLASGTTPTSGSGTAADPWVVPAP